MKLKKNIKIESAKIGKDKNHSLIKCNFRVLKIEKFLNRKKYFFKKDGISSGYILLVLSSENEGHKIYLGDSGYENSIDKNIKLLKEHIFIQNKKVKYKEYFIVLKKDHFIDNEAVFYELFALFNFLLIAELKEKLSKDDLLKKINRFSLYGIFNFKRWSGVSNDQLFFDVNHNVGTIKNYVVQL
ncbi:hypothetical protein [Flavobacterium sp. Root186]|uniref:hypothetical protein n=1 Tax=Flavobacterium sp. Root186 TaxID=1736485 RepID=UPI0006F937A4|nr:hypothetical protein [Flavobacterium sp. Root186]KRB59640.1 hypothetical protein ASD98_00520 [Flavobacterium sp. Root186]